MIFVYRCYLKLSHYLKQKAKKYDLALLKTNLLKSGGRVGNNLTIGNDVMISGLANVDIGDNVSIGTGAFIRAEGGVKIGNNVVISRNLVMYTTSHNYEGSKLPFDESNILKEVIIEDNVWIGMNVTISPGTIIREGAIIALGSTVWGEIEKYKIIGSVAPKIISERDSKHYNFLRNEINDK